ncbi:hypothetical protein IVA87_13925 [Bradyrhizobium sp. 147]|uniref:hypothetical protein n=1 Tax=unclassified Bradyrhizobium TaxID=2631580 RepID=UPI001FFB38EA|nr:MULTISPECIES: hypothetical protein [unclassified Bradyrhizobium]MCK1354264.1 hypothetical protein [Bradyrhizobium sp. CW7]MCK1680499.1 hypothetical protein [Bradyrhizobium sp. 147]
MRKVSIGIRWTPSPLRGCRIGLREQLALLGISGVIVTGAICAVAMLYASGAQRELNGSNEFKRHVTALSQTFLESGQIAREFVRKPSEAFVKTHAENNERQLAD